MQAVKVKYRDRQKYICYEGPLSFASFLECIAKKFDIPTLDFKVYDDSKTEVDEEVFDFLLKKQVLGVLEICSQNQEDDLSSITNSSFASCSGETEGDSDDTIIPQRSPASAHRIEHARLSHMIESILKAKPGGDRIINEYARTKTLTDRRRRDMVNILVAQMTKEHGTSPPKRVKEEYAKGIIALFPYLADPKSKLGYEHYYSAEGGGSGFLSWRLKFVQKEASDRQKGSSQTPSPKGGPKANRGPLQEEDRTELTESQCSEAIALMKHTTDEAIIKEKMKQTFLYRQTMVHDPEKSSDIFSVFSRFLDIPGLIEQDFRLMFGDATSAKFLEKWPTVFKHKVLKESHGLTQTSELQDLTEKAASTSEVEEGWDREMSSILILLHLLPPPPQGRKRPGKLSARQACDQLVKFLKTGTSIEDHLDNIKESRQPYLLACGNKRSLIHKFYIVIDKHALPCKSMDTLAAFDELFKAHFVFGTSYNEDLINVYNFLQTTIYDIDVENTKVNPRVAELRARLLR